MSGFAAVDGYRSTAAHRGKVVVSMNHVERLYVGQETDIRRDTPASPQANFAPGEIRRNLKSGGVRIFLALGKLGIHTANSEIE